jgi:hypothetical protein
MIIESYKGTEEHTISNMNEFMQNFDLIITIPDQIRQAYVGWKAAMQRAKTRLAEKICP